MTEKLSDLERAITTMENEITTKQSSLASLREKFSLLKAAAIGESSTPEKKYFFEKVPGTPHRIKLLMSAPGITIIVDECKSEHPQHLLDWMGKQCRKYNICLDAALYRELQLYLYQETFVKTLDGIYLPSQKKRIEIVSNRDFTII
jgi:hypothetical protein